MIGACVSVTACDYVYTGGLESGVSVVIIGYARFMNSKSASLDFARKLAMELSIDMFQKSYSIEGPDVCEYYQSDLK